MPTGLLMEQGPGDGGGGEAFCRYDAEGQRSLCPCRYDGALPGGLVTA